MSYQNHAYCFGQHTVSCWQESYPWLLYQIFSQICQLNLDFWVRSPTYLCVFEHFLLAKLYHQICANVDQCHFFLQRFIVTTVPLFVVSCKHFHSTWDIGSSIFWFMSSSSIPSSSVSGFGSGGITTKLFLSLTKIFSFLRVWKIMWDFVQFHVSVKYR